MSCSIWRLTMDVTFMMALKYYFAVQLLFIIPCRCQIHCQSRCQNRTRSFASSLIDGSHCPKEVHLIVEHIRDPLFRDTAIPLILPVKFIILPGWLLISGESTVLRALSISIGSDLFSEERGRELVGIPVFSVVLGTFSRSDNVEKQLLHPAFFLLVGLFFWVMSLVVLFVVEENIYYELSWYRICEHCNKKKIIFSVTEALVTEKCAKLSNLGNFFRTVDCEVYITLFGGFALAPLSLLRFIGRNIRAHGNFSISKNFSIISDLRNKHLIF